MHLRIAGKEFSNRVASISDGAETYVPLDVLGLFGADWHINDRGDALIVTAKPSGKQSELALARPNGSPMIALSDIAKIVDGVVSQPDALGKDGKPILGQKGDVVYLLARVTGAVWDGFGLHIATSFPVPYHVRPVAEMKPARSYVDLVGAAVADEFKPAPLPTEDPRPLKLRTGQNTAEIARIVVELADGIELKASDSTSNSETRILAGVESRPVRPANIAKNEPPKTPAVQPGKIGGTQPNLQNNIAANSGNQGGGGSVVKPGPEKTRLGNNSLASRGGGKRQEQPILVRGVSFSTDNETQFHVEIATSGKVLPYIHYVPGTTQMVMDIPNAVLDLPNPEDAERTATHRLVHGIHVHQEAGAQPMTRVVLDTMRVVGYRSDQTGDKITLDLILPKNATGALSDKIIVVDAGHGGSAPGADGRGGGVVVYEKNVTLAIALKLRDALEACGAHVIMTRDRDTDVGLQARSDIANNCGADLFVSIHNDSNGAANSASGTSTYYHMQDASSRALATCVQEAVMAVTGLPSRGVLSDSIMYQSGFAVLRGSHMPAVLCEVAYINNAKDRRKLVDEEFQQRVATAICDGLRRYVEGNGASSASIPNRPRNPFNDPPTGAPSGKGEE